MPSPQNFTRRLLVWHCLFALSFLQAQVGYEEAFSDISFNFPVEIQHASDGSDRLFVLEQPGIIKVFPNNESVSPNDVSTFLDIRGRVSYSAGQEIGLLGLAFHPNYEENGYFYVYYTADSSNPGVNIQIVVARFQVNEMDPDTADPGSEQVLFRFDKNQSDSNHNGGKIAFGPDGYLYISIGDGGGAGDPSGNGQDLSTAFGSMLRIDVDLNGDNPLENNLLAPDGNYEIPSDNPRVGLSGLDELYAWGLRNTWKFSFDEPTGRLWGADVGQDGFEEINLIESGNNYGWNRLEANSVEDESTPLVTTPDTRPLYSYNHSNGDVSITGGYVYRGPGNNAILQGRYVFGDYISGRVWMLNYDPDAGSASAELLFRTNGQSISSFGLDEAGNMYFCAYSESAKLYRITMEMPDPEPVPVEGIGNWDALREGTDGAVRALAVDAEGQLIAGGSFSEAGGATAGNLATYSPNSGWEALGAGTNGPVYAVISLPDGGLYIGGEFTEVDGTEVSNIAYYDGTAWSAMEGGANGPVAALQIDSEGKVYAGGAFETAGGTTVNNIAVWTGSDWEALATAGGAAGTNNEIRALAMDADDVLYLGGNFDTAGGLPAARIATWDGESWGSLGDGTSGFVQAIAITPDALYAGGNFSLAGNTTVNRIARWDFTDETWESLGNGLGGNVNALAIHDEFLYAAGNFNTAADDPETPEIMNNISRWSESGGWEALGPGTAVGVNAPIFALIFNPGTSSLYAGGNFISAGPVDASRIALWGPDFLDTDNDGVVDTGDACPGTRPNVAVDSNGCEITGLPADAFEIAVRGNSCIGSENGGISVRSDNANLTYTARLTGAGMDEEYIFSDNLQIDQLAAGPYRLCITAAGVSNFESCSGIVVPAPEPLQVQSSLEQDSGLLTLRLSGSDRYQIKINSLELSTSEEEFKMVLQEEINSIEVRTELECQGVFQEELIWSSGPDIYPNPFGNEIYVSLGILNPVQVQLELYDLGGTLIHSHRYENPGASLRVDTATLSRGMYVLRLLVDGTPYLFKTVKK